MKPIFLLSLPRSGSTLLQRIISAHEKVSTISEPWVLLPLYYAVKSDGVVAEYHQESLSLAVSDFIDALPNGNDDYYEACRLFTDSMYTKLMDVGAEYFLDKTPRYCFIASELKKTYPDAKFIVLWRNPVAILSSRFHSFGNKWRVYNYKVDLYKGLESLIAFTQEHSESICQVNYESLITSPTEELAKIFGYLDLEADESVLNKFSSVGLKGRVGDMTGSKEYNAVDQSPLNKWKNTLGNPLRVWWCKRYIKWIGADRLLLMGYDYDELLSELNSITAGYKGLMSDSIRFVYGVIDELFEIWLFKQKIKQMKRGKRLYVHR